MDGERNQSVRKEQKELIKEISKLKETLTYNEELIKNLLKSKEDSSLLFDKMLNGFALHEIILDKEGKPCDYRFLEVNLAFEKLTGLERDKIIGKIALAVLPDLEHSWIETYGKIALTGKPVHFDHYSQSLKRNYDVTVYSPKKKYFATIFSDITDRKRMEDALQLLSSRNEAILGLVPDIIMEVDNNKVYRWANKAGLAFFGNDVIGKEAAFYFEGGQDTYFKVEPLFQGAEDLVYVESWQRRYDGEKRLLAWWCRTLKDAEGKVTGALSSAQDITERKQAEDAIINSNKQLKKISNFENTIQKINQSILRSANEHKLYQNICDNLKKLIGVKLVWIGLTEEKSFDVKPVAYTGAETGFLSQIKVKYDDSKYGKGPAGTAIKTGKPVVMDDIKTDTRYIHWRKEALRRGLASNIALPLIHEDKPIGVMSVYSDKENAFGKEEVEFLEEVANDIAVGVKSIRFEENLKKSNKQLQKAIENTIFAIAKVSEKKDLYTAGHQKRVSQLATAIAKKMNLSDEKIESVRFASLIHDIGKISIPGEILTKPAKLTETEFALVKEHPKICYDIIKDIDLPWNIADIVLQHHERLDGSGYPKGLKDKEILIEAKIIAVADAVEAMNSHRPYRPALGIDKALEEISMNKGKLYDPDAVEACIKLFKQSGFKFE